MTEKVPKTASEFLCEPCDFKCFKLSNWNAHISTRKHLDIRQNGSEKCQEYKCEICDVVCCKLSKWNRHILTVKHLQNIKRSEKCHSIFACKKCNKSYKSRGSLWNHESRCSHAEPQHDALINRVLSDNLELRNFIVEQSKTIEKIMMQNTEVMSKALESNKIITTNNNITNNNNNKFNINIFLNEQCKDAYNFNEFVKNIEISYEDLENNAQLGFVQGISKIFIDNLRQLGVNERPIHCTDVKREVMYIKDEDKWTKEVDDSKLQKAIQTVSYKSMGKLMEWKQENPDYQDADSEFSKRCLDMQRQSLAGSDREVYYPKVIHVLAKETMVDK
jgi:hypothetical protein